MQHRFASVHASPDAVPLPKLGSTAAALHRPWQMLMRRRGMVLLGMACVPLHAAVSLWMPSVMGGVLDQLEPGSGPPSATATGSTAAAQAALADSCWQ